MLALDCWSGRCCSRVVCCCSGRGRRRPAPAESISRFDTRIEVRADGLLQVTETIEYDFGTARHGILREIPVELRYDDSRDRVYPIEHIAVAQDGERAEVNTSSSDGYEVFKIGDPDRTLSGNHTYVISYQVSGALNHFADHEELYWNITGNEWDVPIESASATITGPAGIQRVECFAGPTGSRSSCAAESMSGNTATFRQSDLARGSGLTAVVAFPPGSVRGTGPILRAQRSSSPRFQVTRWSVGGGVFAALLSTAAALAAAWLIGRDRRYVGLLPGLTPGYGQRAKQRRAPLFGKPPVAVEFVPPPLAGGVRTPRRPGLHGNEIRPGQAGTLIDGKANVLDVTATIIDFAVRRHLHIRELPKAARYGAKDWELTRLTDGDGDFLQYERKLFDALFPLGRDSVRLSELKGTFAGDLALVRRGLDEDVVRQGWYGRSPARTRAAVRRTAVLILLAAIGIEVGLAWPTLFAFAVLGLAVGAVVLLGLAGRFPARTGQGSATLARVQGFRRYVATAEAAQIRFEERAEIFSRYLPYAMVFGLAGRWSSEFSRIGAVRPDGTAGLYWYAGESDGWTDSYDAAIGGFTIAATSSVSASSGFSGYGGGFGGGSGDGGASGDGGGGGGGGSW